MNGLRKDAVKTIWVVFEVPFSILFPHFLRKHYPVPPNDPPSHPSHYAAVHDSKDALLLAPSYLERAVQPEARTQAQCVAVPPPEHVFAVLPELLEQLHVLPRAQQALNAGKLQGQVRVARE